MITGKVIKVSDGLVVADNMRKANISDVVQIGSAEITGEIVAIMGERASIQVYEDTSGIGCEDIVVSSESPLFAELGPGLIGNIFDGILRPLDAMYKKYGANMAKGIYEPSLDRDKKWNFTPAAESGLRVRGGDIIGTVEETPMIIHKVLVPPDVEGEIVEIYEGEFTVEEVVATVQMPNGETTELFLMQKWALRHARPYARKFAPDTPMITGQRVIDSFFPIAHGGTACISGSFASGKTSIMRQIAKYGDSDIVVFISCGARGNEVAEIFREFSETQDIQGGHLLMQKTVFITNTANMSVVSRETVVYTGMTVAEYFRDMGYSVAVIIDSVSEWANALREISGKLGETTGDECYPAYLPSRLSQIYERAGKVVCLGIDERNASLTVIGSVSAVDGDSITQAAMKSVRTFWSLDENLEYSRCFPAVNIVDSYSFYKDRLDQYFSANINKNWLRLMREAHRLVRREGELQDAARLDGSNTLPASDKLTLETARSIREGYLMQNAEDDLYSTVYKQYDLMRLIIEFYQKAQKVLENGAEINIDIEKILQLPVRERIAQAKFMPSDDYKSAYGEILKEIDTEFAELVGKYLANKSII